jgi:hypothetical protein
VSLVEFLRGAQQRAGMPMPFLPEQSACTMGNLACKHDLALSIVVFSFQEQSMDLVDELQQDVIQSPSTRDSDQNPMRPVTDFLPATRIMPCRINYLSGV